MSEGNGFATRELFVRKAPRRYKEIEVPNFGKVRIQSLSEGEKSRWENAARHRKTGGIVLNRLEDARQRLIVLCVVDGNGQRIFKDSDVTALADLDGAVAHMIFDEAASHCGLTKDDIEGLTELEKNSDAIHDDSSPTN